MGKRKIVITTQDPSGLKSPICRNFGKSPYYVIAEVNGKEVIETQVNANLRFNGHQMGLLHTAYHCGATVLLAGGMEPRVCGMFRDIGVDVVCELDGTAEEALFRYLLSEDVSCSGRISPEGNNCSV